jgi:hypothetical protein
MPAAKVNLKIEQGATFRQKFTWKDAKGKPVNLTGYTAKLQVRDSAGATTVLLELTTENVGIVLGGTAGTIELMQTDEQTAALTFLKGVYDLLLLAADGTALRLIEGSVTVVPGVTRV